MCLRSCLHTFVCLCVSGKSRDTGAIQGRDGERGREGGGEDRDRLEDLVIFFCLVRC